AEAAGEERSEEEEEAAERSSGCKVRQKRSRAAGGHDQPDGKARGKDDRVREQSVLRVDGPEQGERRGEDGTEKRLAPEAERAEARGDEGDSGHDHEDAQVAGRQKLGERPRLDRGRIGLGDGLGLGAGLGHRKRGGAHQLLSAWKTDTTAGPRMTTNRAGKIMKTSGNSILIGAFCAACSASARRRLRIS